MSEQRQHSRSSVHTPVEVVDIESGIDFRAEAIDLSPAGLSFHAPMEPAMGAEMEVNLPFIGTAGRFTVLRITQTSTGFHVAGVLKPR
jgi:hypothetical protein